MLRIYPDVVVGLQIEAELNRRLNRLTYKRCRADTRKRAQWDYCWSSQPDM